MSTKKKSKIDIRSITNVTLIYFILFAVLLVAMIWVLQGLFMDRYYEEMKSDETRSTALVLKADYDNGDIAFVEHARLLSVTNGVFIRAEFEESPLIFDNGTRMDPNSYMFARELASIRSTLDESKLGIVSEKLEDQSHITRYVVAMKLGVKNDMGYLFVIAPLLPVQSTVSILRTQLFYISTVALTVALLLAIIFANRLSAPIRGITRSAQELSRGNFDVTFSGGEFTETRELAKTLNTASYEMQKTEYYQRDLIANVSHDLKTPLTMIRSYAEMIEDFSGDEPKKRKEHLDIIIHETDRLNKLVSDMLSVSRLQSNSTELSKEKFDIVKATEEVLETFEVLNEQANYNIMPILCKSTYVFGDEHKIKQVMTNLISNAVKYCGEDKFIKVEVKRQGKKVRFDVVDHGPGIASEELSHVWDRYYRTSANQGRDIEGTGLGLSIVKGILTLHNAGYGVDSTEGEGSDFWFTMDIVKK